MLSDGSNSFCAYVVCLLVWELTIIATMYDIQHHKMHCFLRRSRGFGFIKYKDTESVDNVQKARPHKIDDRDVETKRAMPRDVSYQETCHSELKTCPLSFTKSCTQ